MKNLAEVVKEYEEQGWRVFSGWESSHHKTVMLEKRTTRSLERIAVEQDAGPVTITQIGEWFYNEPKSHSVKQAA